MADIAIPMHHFVLLSRDVRAEGQPADPDVVVLRKEDGGDGDELSSARTIAKSFPQNIHMSAASTVTRHQPPYAPEIITSAHRAAMTARIMTMMLTTRETFLNVVDMVVVSFGAVLLGYRGGARRE